MLEQGKKDHDTTDQADSPDQWPDPGDAGQVDDRMEHAAVKKQLRAENRHRGRYIGSGRDEHQWGEDQQAFPMIVDDSFTARLKHAWLAEAVPCSSQGRGALGENSSAGLNDDEDNEKPDAVEEHAEFDGHFLSLLCPTFTVSEGMDVRPVEAGRGV